MARALTCVIMAGGKGERLWPLVRVARPKVCVSTTGSASLLEETLDRLNGLSRSQRVLIITAGSQAKPIRAVLPASAHPSVITEPQPRNTAACIVLAAATVAAKDPEGIMAVMPADHWINPASGFRRSLKAAIDLAAAHPTMVTIGLRPTRVHTGLGHLCTDVSTGTKHGCATRRLARFVEKPTAELAHQLMAAPGTYWNAGIFVARAQTFLDLIAQHLPEHAAQIVPLGPLVGRPAFARRAAAAYRAVAPVSFDHGVMDHLRDGYVVEAAYHWEDLGSWDSWVRMSQPRSPAVLVESPNTRIVTAEGADDHLVAVVGVDNLIVVHTPDATLICRADQAQAVRAAVAQLAERKSLARYR